MIVLTSRRAAACALTFATTIVSCSSSTTPPGGANDGGGGSGSGPKGTAQIFVVPEDSIGKGLDPGTALENIQDGWTIRYSRYLVTVGNFRAKRSDTGESVGDAGLYVLDLKNAPTSGYVVTELKELATVRWDKFGYDVANATAGVRALAPTKDTDVAFMVENGYSVYFEGTAAKDGETISFRWGFAAGTSLDDCATEGGLAGFAVPAGGTVQVKPTLHGDHAFFDNVTQGVEITKRLAQWMKTCDRDGSKELTLAELRTCDVATALPSPPYDLTAIKDQDGDGKLSVYDYVNTQMRTFGDFQGDGECPTRKALP